jgi:hypothetical protein
MCLIPLVISRYIVWLFPLLRKFLLNPNINTKIIRLITYFSNQWFYHLYCGCLKYLNILHQNMDHSASIPTDMDIILLRLWYTETIKIFISYRQLWHQVKTIKPAFHWHTNMHYILIDTNSIFIQNVSLSDFHSGIVWYH